MMPRSRDRIGDSSERDTTSRIADSDTAWMVERGSERLKRNCAGSRTFQIDLEVDVDDVLVAGQHQAGAGAADRAEPISSTFSRVTWMMSRVTIGQGAKLRPGWPMQSPRHSPKVSSTACSSGRTV
jgi:hypothetical protein